MLSRKLQSSKYTQKKRARRAVRNTLWLLCMLVSAAFVLLILKSSLFQITTIHVAGADTTSQKEIQETVMSTLSKTSSPNIFLFSKDAVTKAILDAFPMINSLTISRSGLGALAIGVEERTPAVTVCFGFREESTDADCYVSDRRGYIFAPAASTTASSLNHYYVSTDKGTSPIGTTFTDEKHLGALEHLVQGVHAGGLTPLGILIGENGTYEMYVKNKEGESEVTIYLDDKAPFDTTLANLLTFWNASTSTFDYINLRFGNTVYYSTQ